MHWKWPLERMVETRRFRKKPDDESTGVASLDFQSAVSINLDAAVRDDALQDVSNLMITMFKFAKYLNEDSNNPAWDFSDKLGLRVVRKSLKQMLLEWLPNWLSDGATQAVHFACVDISPAPTAT